MKGLAILSIAAMLCLTGCMSGEPDMLTSVSQIDAPAPQQSAQPNLAVGPGGEIYLSWIELDAAGAKVLRFAQRAEQGWAEARTIVQSDDLLVNYADYPSVFALPGGGLAAHWLATIAGTEGYNVNIAVSNDKGATWSKPVMPHRDGTPTEHGFVSLAPSGSGVSVIWLDSRKLAAGSDEVALMQTQVALDGTLTPESEIDPRVCECCQPSSIPVKDGLLAVYRDRSGEEIRDIAIVRFDGTRWTAPKIIAEDKWQIYACPIQGPALAAAGENVAVAWFTAPDDKPKVQVALSKDGGVTFGSPVQVDDGNPIGRVDVVALESGGAVVTWIEHSRMGGEVRARQVGSGGRKYDAVTLAKTSVGSASGFPRVERSGKEIVFAWADTSEKRVRTAVAGKK